MKILIGYDGSECADVALLDLRRAGLPREGEALVVSVADVWFRPGEDDQSLAAQSASEQSSSPRGQAMAALEEARRLAQRASERVKESFPQWKVEAEAYADSPAWGIIKKADEWQPDLIVVGSHGRTAVGQMLLGSVSQKVLHQARASVRIARGNEDEKPPAVSIIVGVDGSAEADAAVSEVARRNWPEGSQVCLVSSVNLVMTTAIDWIETDYQDEWEWLSKIVEAAADRLRGAGLAVTSVIKEGDPKHLLRDEAERLKADSIFVGARGLRGIDRLLLGSVSSSVASRAHCSVEVVRAK